MKHNYLILTVVALLSFQQAVARAHYQQDTIVYTAKEIIQKSIDFHDPEDRWGEFNASFKILMSMPDRPNRLSKISINLPKETFNLESSIDGSTTSYTVMKDSIEVFKKNTDNDSITVKDKERATMMMDYYTYLYGLPMKLQDDGTIVHDKVEKVWFWNINAFKVKVTYAPEVGTDVWYFYFDTKTFALKAYQFYKTDENGNVDKDSGEYILISKPKVIDGIKIPTERNWFYNKNTWFLAKDLIVD